MNIPHDVKTLLDTLSAYGKPYLVGGCVRDHLMHIEPHDYDVVMVDADMEKACAHMPSIKPIGQAFLVYQATTETGRTVEIALPRTERKVGEGHTGFVMEACSTIEEDLMRRDFTINAIAYDYRTEKFITAHPRSIEHVHNRLLYHTSPAFCEDPLRVFRAARFAATKHLRLAPQTLGIFSEMKEELKTLSKERVRVELEKSLLGHTPSRFFYVLADAGVLDVWFPELQAMIGLAHRHEEGDVFVHTMMVIDVLSEELADVTDKSDHIPLMLSGLAHDFGKPHVSKDLWPKMYGHEGLAKEPISQFCERLGYGSSTERCMQMVAKNHMKGHRIGELRAGTVFELLTEAQRTKIGIAGLIKACKADCLGRIKYNKDIVKEWKENEALFIKATMGMSLARWPEGAHWQEINDCKIKSIKYYLMNDYLGKTQ
jgi:tRNA nucleotidyltransferase (CCA-adding enzyme)